MAKSKKQAKAVEEIEVVDPVIVEAPKEEEVLTAEEVFPVVESDFDLDSFATDEMVAAIARYRNNRDNGSDLKKLINKSIK